MIDSWNVKGMDGTVYVKHMNNLENILFLAVKVS